MKDVVGCFYALHLNCEPQVNGDPCITFLLFIDTSVVDVRLHRLLHVIILRWNVNLWGNPCFASYRAGLVGTMLLCIKL